MVGAEITNQIEPAFDALCMEVIHRWERGELHFKDAIATLQTLSQEATSTGKIANRGRAEHLLGYIHHYLGNLNTSIRHYEQSRSCYRSVGDGKRAAAIDLNLGENYRYKGDFTRAIYLYHAAYDAAAEHGDIRIQTMAAVNEGLALTAIGNNQEARQVFEIALKLTAEWTDNTDQLPMLLCELYHGMTTIALKEEQLELAHQLALRTWETAQQTDKPLLHGYAQRTLADVISAFIARPDDYQIDDDPDSYYREALGCFQEVNAEAEMARTMYHHALSLAQRGRRTTAARKLQQVMIIFTRLDMVDDAARAAEAQLSVI